MENPEQSNERRWLTEREREVVGLSAQGLTNRAVSERLGLAESTVKDILARVMRRLGCANRMQLLSVISQRLEAEEPSS